MAEKTVKVYDGEKLIVDAVYCRKTETGEVGWYDSVAEKFHPEQMQRIESGVQYIDTGIDPASLRTKGEWADDKDDVYWHNYFIHKHCSVCGKEAIYDYAMGRYILTHFCPNCGADMRGETP